MAEPNLDAGGGFSMMRAFFKTVLLGLWLVFVAPFTVAFEEIVPPVFAVDSRRAARAIRAVENWDGKSVGASGELGPWQMLPSTWRMFSSRPLWWAWSARPECRAEQEAAALRWVEWIRRQLPELGLGDSVWAIGLVHNAGYGHVAAGLAKPRNRAFADRVRAVYEAEPRAESHE